MESELGVDLTLALDAALDFVEEVAMEEAVVQSSVVTSVNVKKG
jgi:hypothetical protein